MTRSTQQPGGSSGSHRSTVASGSLRSKSAKRRSAPPKAPAKGTKSPESSRGAEAPAKPRPTRRPAPKKRTAAPAKKRGTPPPFIAGPGGPGRRLAPAYDLEGPRIRLGIGWFFVVFLALGIGRLAGDVPLIGFVYAAAAALAAAQIVVAWAGHSERGTQICAMLLAVVVGLSATFGAGALGAAQLGATAVSVVFGAIHMTRKKPLLPTVALVLQASLPPALIVASLLLTLRYEIGACVILVVMVMAFDVGDFLIGSGAGSVVEGPVAGAIMILLVGAVAAVISAPPFHGIGVWPFALDAMVLCPLGQVAASWLLPDATTRASALRRLDSLLILAPVWTFAVGLVVAHS